ncbi:hypothetical protein IFT77_11845 [Frigoribacterium sp. CFBP 13729]|uniref:hypothetical protein n=1 Tax=Frigoribacterium sp. CFBP 13729 TaxID=2775293 RepID=UPI00177B7F95|nr:hypothetical protein [Frigoribacterium sp. CFBP 13729]MBD8611181.1 hypothetical protein [Frigoribacterium sp. CFBP 13729]
MRGLAAQNYIFTMMLVSANLRRLATFVREPAEGREYVETHKNRVSNYHRFYRAPEIERGMTKKRSARPRGRSKSLKPCDDHASLKG